MSDIQWVDLTDDIVALELAGTSITCEWGTAPGKPDGYFEGWQCLDCGDVLDGTLRKECGCGKLWLRIDSPIAREGGEVVDVSGVRYVRFEE